MASRAHLRPTGRSRSGGPRLTRRASWRRRPVPGRGEVDHHAAAGASSSRAAAQQGARARRRCRCCRRRAARCPSGPRRASASKTLRRSAGTPRRRACSTASCTMSTASTAWPARAGGRSSGPARSRRRWWRPGSGSAARGRSGRGAQPVVRRAAARSSGWIPRTEQGSPRRASVKTSLKVTWRAPSVAVLQPGRRPETRRCSSPRPRGELGVPGRRAATDSASADLVDVAQGRRSRVDPGAGRARAPSRVRAPVWLGGHRHLGEVGEQVGAGDAEQPPAPVVRRTEDRVVGAGQQRRRPDAGARGSSWGVSMPTCTTGAPVAAWTSVCACSQPLGEPVAALGVDGPAR